MKLIILCFIFIKIFSIFPCLSFASIQAHQSEADGCQTNLQIDYGSSPVLRFYRKSYRIYAPEDMHSSGSIPYSMDWLEKLILDKQFTSVDEVIRELPTDLRRSFSLVLGSNSTQFGSASDPRVILSSPDSRFLMAFAGQAPKQGFDSIEIIEYDLEKKEFIPSQIQLLKTNQGIKWKFNYRPQQCNSCHGEPFRPLWDSYSFWPRFYGAFSGNEYTGEFLRKVMDREKILFNEFSDKRLQHSRYQSLLGWPTKLKELEEVNTAVTTHLNKYNVERVSKYLRKLCNQKPVYRNLLRITITNLARNTDSMIEIYEHLSLADQERFKQVFPRIKIEISSEMERLPRLRLEQHLRALGIREPLPENIWSHEFGFDNFDFGHHVSRFRSEGKNEQSRERIKHKLALFRFVLENLLEGDWSILFMNQKATMSASVTDGITTAWEHLLKEGF